ncbi:MAG TPA: tetratricopeptide repeat protein [Miltoncostaeaceae bacterium]|nr:tetratricopeptide repeat protein [Miltoncostaeaceae bacterium]
MGLKIASLSGATAATAPQRLSLCMIMRDEEEHLERCLASVRGVVDEIVIVDTGSTDRSVAIAEAHGAQVLHEEWTGDFARHRNTSLDAATGDWILVLDADEELVGGEALRPLLDDPAMEGYSLREVNYIGEEAGMEAVVNAAFRLFRNRPAYRYEGALHEQIQGKVDPQGGERTRFVGVEINHYGYLDATTEAKRKKDRNMRIVLEEVRRKPDDAFTLFNAGVEFQRIDDHSTALDYFGRAFSHLGSMRQYFASLLVRNIVASLKSLERYDEALEVCADALSAYPDFTDLHYLQGQLHFARREYREAIRSFHRAIDLGDHGGDRYMAQAGMGSYYSWFALGVLHEAIGDQSEAVRCYRRAITTAPGFHAAPLVRLAQLVLVSDPVDRALGFLRGLLPATRRHDALRAVAEVLLSQGHPQEAATLLDEALGLSPATQAIRVTMAHCRLATGDVAGALAALDQVPPTSDSHPFACAKRALVGVAEGDAAVVADAIARLGAEDGVYGRAWTIAVGARTGAGTGDAGGMDPAALTAALLDMAATLLELGRLDAFNTLVPALYAHAPDAAQLDEKLGLLLYHEGFADPAADRLMRALGAGSVSPPALATLARICADKGFADEAETFWREALVSDDQNLSRYLDLVGHLAGGGRYAEADDVLRAGLAVWPHSTVLRELRGSLSMLAGART